MANATSTELQELYIAYFGRPADPSGLSYWTELGVSQADFAAHMHAQDEFQTVNADKSVDAQVNQIYNNLFGRQADVGGLEHWTLQINLGNLVLAEIATHLIYSLSAEKNAGDRAVLAAKTEAAEAFTAKVAETTDGRLAYKAESKDPYVAGE